MWLRKRLSSKGFVAVRAVTSLVFVIAAIWLWFNQQYVLDQITVWQYKPTAEIARLADNSGLNSKGTFLYYASQPEIDGTQRFNQVCDRKEEATAVLGCYNGNQIFIYDVKDERLKGIKEVTAAHEMLHAAWQRFSESEREKIGALLEIEYRKLESNAEYSERMAFYARTEPGQRANELHSLIATEVREISPELSKHYEQFFSDRNKVVALHEAYRAVFEKLDAEAEGLYAELQELAQTIHSTSERYNKDVETLNREIQDFNARAEAGQFASQLQFNDERAELIGRADDLEATRAGINDRVTAYESKRQAYNKIANESRQLVDSLDSNLAPAPSV